MFGDALATDITKNIWISDKLNHDYMYIGTKTFKNIFYSLLNPFFSAVLPLLVMKDLSEFTIEMPVSNLLGKSPKRLVIHSKDTDGHNIDKD